MLEKDGTVASVTEILRTDYLAFLRAKPPRGHAVVTTTSTAHRGADLTFGACSIPGCPTGSRPDDKD